MRLQGRYKVDIKDAGVTIKTFETRNIIVDGGLQRVADWLRFDKHSDGAYPMLKQIDTTGMTVTHAGFSNPTNAVDGSSSSYAGATVNNASWDNVWWRIDFGLDKNLIAMYVDWMEDDVNRGADYKFQYSQDGSSWTDMPARFRPPQESNIRGKALFFTADAPPMEPVTARYVRLNTQRGDTNQTLALYQIRFYEPNAVPLSPGVMAIGTGSMDPPPSGGETALRDMAIAKAVVNAVQPSGYMTRLIMSLDGDEGNGLLFTEAGMLFGDEDYLVPASGNCPNLFSRGIFEPSGWQKSPGQTADVYYEIGVTHN